MTLFYGRGYWNRQKIGGVSVLRACMDYCARTVQTGPAGPDEQWAMDFVSDALMCGRRIRILTIADPWDRSSPARHIICFRDITLLRRQQITYSSSVAALEKIATEALRST